MVTERLRRAGEILGIGLLDHVVLGEGRYYSFAEEAVHRLYDVLEELAGNAFATVRQRVARHLLDLAAARPAAAGRVTALVSQQDLANSVGSVREVVARVLAELRAEGLVLTSPGRVEILDPVRLSRQLW